MIVLVSQISSPAAIFSRSRGPRQHSPGTIIHPKQFHSSLLQPSETLPSSFDCRNQNMITSNVASDPTATATQAEEQRTVGPVRTRPARNAQSRKSDERGASGDEVSAKRSTRPRKGPKPRRSVNTTGVPRKRGRPRKYIDNSEPPESEDDQRFPKSGSIATEDLESEEYSDIEGVAIEIDEYGNAAPVTPPDKRELILQGQGTTVIKYRQLPPTTGPFLTNQGRKRAGSIHVLADGPDGPYSRPPYPYSTLIRYAIEASPDKKLTLNELYMAIEKRFPWFGQNGAGWKNSIRHNLSLNKSFIKVPRPLTEPGKGSYWMVDRSAKEPTEADEELANIRVDSGSHGPPIQQSAASSSNPPVSRRKEKRKKVVPSSFMTDNAGDNLTSYDLARWTASRTEAVQQAQSQAQAQSQTQPAVKRSSEAPKHSQNQYWSNLGQESQNGGRPVYSPSGVEATFDSILNGSLASAAAPLIDDRPDPTAPRTIYNHTTSGLGIFGPPPLGALGASTSHRYLPFAQYGQYPRSNPTSSYTSSLGGALSMPALSASFGDLSQNGGR